MDPQFEELSEEIARNVTTAVTAAVNKHVTEVVTAAEKRLSHQANINAEAVKEVAKLPAEGYTATLDGINRKLDDIKHAATNRLDDHDGVLDNHNQRIKTLEQLRP
jgi:phage-related minor tail protein